MKQYLIPNALIAGLVLSTPHPANAGEDFSIGASAVRAAVGINHDGVNIDGDATGFRVFGLYMFNRNFGIEAGISAFGEPDDNTIPSDMEVETNSYDVFAVGKYWASERFSLIGKAGFASSRTETEIGDNDETETSHSSIDLALSLGGQYDIGERFGIRSELEWRDGQDSGAERMISVSGLIRFQ